MYVIGARIDFTCTLQTREFSTAPPDSGDGFRRLEI